MNATFGGGWLMVVTFGWYLLFIFLEERVEFDSFFDSTTPSRYEKAFKGPGVQRNAPCRGHLCEGCDNWPSKSLTLLLPCSSPAVYEKRLK